MGYIPRNLSPVKTNRVKRAFWHVFDVSKFQNWDIFTLGATMEKSRICER